MTPQEFQDALDTIQRDNPMGREMDKALRARKEAIARLMDEMDEDDLLTCMRGISAERLPTFMHMVGVEAWARLKDPHKPKLSSAWDILMGED